MPTISIGFQITNAGANGFQQLVLDAADLRNLLTQSVVESQKLENKMVGFGKLSQGLDSLTSVFEQLKGFTKEFTDAYDAQMEAEYQLEQVMRNTMGARTEDIQSIKDFCSAQQQIGIVGDEVQLAGAQEMATYVSMKGTLKTLIPVMNDMVAQQYGYNHTAENAVGIATMLGKVMNGQTSALSRLGYSFNEVQEQILKYGTESEKAAVLAEVVGESVGGMNQRLAETDTGQMKQLENYFGDLKEQIGGILKTADPFIAMASNAATAFIGLQRLCSGIKALAASMRLLSVAGGVVTLVLTAIAAAYFYFTSQTDEATESLKRLTDAKHQAAEADQRAKEIAEAEDDARKSALASLELNIAKTKDFKGTKAEERKLVDELNNTYGRTMGYFKSVSEWYIALTKNSKAYCDQMVAEAKARKLADQIADLELQKKDIQYNKDGTAKMYGKERTVNIEWEEYINENGLKALRKITKTELDLAKESVAQLDKEIAASKKQLEGISGEVEMPVMGSTDKPELGGGGSGGSRGSGSSTPKTRLQEIDAAIKVNEEKWLTASKAEKEAIHATVQALREEKQALELHQAELSRPVALNTIQDFNAEINYQQKLLASASKENVDSIQRTIDALELQREAMSVPAELKSLDDYSKAIAYYQKLRSVASGEEIAQHDETIRKLNEEAAAMERAAHVAIDVDKISTYKQLQDEISYYTDLLQNGTEEEKRFAADRLKDLIGNDENGANGRVEFEIRGDRLFGLLRKYERNKNRT